MSVELEITEAVVETIVDLADVAIAFGIFYALYKLNKKRK